MRETIVEVDGAELHVEERGEGPPIVLLHGHTGTSGDFRHVFDLDELAGRHRVVTPDARGHGRSTNPSGKLTFRKCAEDLVTIFDELEIEPACAVGVSFGALTLLHAATRAPYLFRSLVLVSAVPRFPKETRALFRAAASAKRTEHDWNTMRALHTHGDRQIAALWSSPRAFAASTTDVAFTPKKLRAITARTLLVAGDRDPLYPVELAVELYRGIPDARLWVVPGGGHSPIFSPSQREAFQRIALPFLEA